MPLSADPISRIRKHSRSVRFEGYARADGLWDSPSHRCQARRLSARPRGVSGRQPFQLDRYHALDTGGEAVRLYYPRWQREVKTGTD